MFFVVVVVFVFFFCDYDDDERESARSVRVVNLSQYCALLVQRLVILVVLVLPLF